VTKRGDCRGAIRTSAGRRSRRDRRSPGNIRPAFCAATIRRASSIDRRVERPPAGRQRTKMIHLGKNPRAASSPRAYRGRSQKPIAGSSRRIASRRRAQFHQLRQFADRQPLRRAHRAYIESKNPSAQFEHEATTSKSRRISCSTRCSAAFRGGATALIVNGFVRDVLQQLPMEFAVEAQKLISISLEGASDERAHFATLIADDLAAEIAARWRAANMVPRTTWLSAGRGVARAPPGEETKIEEWRGLWREKSTPDRGGSS